MKFFCKVAFLSLLLIQNSFAGSRLVSTDAACLRLIEKVPDLREYIEHERLEGGRASASLGGVNNLLSHLYSAGATSEQINLLFEVLSDTHLHPIVQDVSDSLVGQEQQPFIYCFLSADCYFQKKWSGNGEVAAYFWRFPKGQLEFQNFKDLEYELMTGEPSRLEVLATKPSRQLEERSIPEGLPFYNNASYFVSGFLHEATHYADWIFINRWISANQKLKDRGHDTDLLFKSVVVVKGEKLYLSSSFRLFFEELRAHAIEFFIYTNYSTQPMSQEITNGARDYFAQQVISYLAGLSQTEVLFLVDLAPQIAPFYIQPIDDPTFGQRSHSLFQLAFGPQSLKSVMKSTIQKANKLQ